MHRKSYRPLIRSLPILLAGIILFFISCRKEEPPVNPPHIAFINDSGYADHDTTLIIGDRIKVGISSIATGSNITFFQITCNNGTRLTLLDSGLNRPELNYSLTIIKSPSLFEKWTFLVMDRDRNKDSIQILLLKSDSSHYGGIKTYTDIFLGAQENISTGSFLSFSDGSVFNLEEAYANQPFIDLVYYYGQYDCTLSSPNEAEAPAIFTGPHGIANWAIKNETRYDTTAVTPQAFDEAANDSLLLSVYEPTAGKRKAKYIAPGMVISFKSPAGKIGLIKIITIEPGTDGSMRCSIKIQE
jgi:hypothetical protein